MKITRDLLKLIFSVYYDCGIRFDNDNKQIYKYRGYLMHLGGQMAANLIPEGWKLSMGGSYNIQLCKLLLSPLNKITDEDATECAKCCEYHPDLKEDWENIISDFAVDEIIRHKDRVEVKFNCICFEGSFNLQFDGHFFMSGEDEGVNAHPTVYMPQRGVDYLRSKGYDCGYGDIPSLIEAGIAVEK